MHSRDQSQGFLVVWEVFNSLVTGVNRVHFDLPQAFGHIPVFPPSLLAPPPFSLFFLSVKVKRCYGVNCSAEIPTFASCTSHSDLSPCVLHIDVERVGKAQ